MLSPVRWAILSLEGAIWRDYSWLELVRVASVLWAIGVLAIAWAVWKNRNLEAQA